MRQFQVLLTILFFLTPVNAAWQAGADLRCLDSAFIPALRVDAEFSYSWDDVRITVPLRYSESFSYDLSFLETGVAVSVYPLEGYGLFIGASIFRGGVFWGIEAPRERFMLMSEIIAGWTFSFPWFFIEPRVSVSGLFEGQDERFSALSEAIPQYSKLRISLIAGIEIR